MISWWHIIKQFVISNNSRVEFIELHLPLKISKDCWNNSIKGESNEKSRMSSNCSNQIIDGKHQIFFRYLNFIRKEGIIDANFIDFVPFSLCNSSLSNILWMGARGLTIFSYVFSIIDIFCNVKFIAFRFLNPSVTKFDIIFFQSKKICKLSCNASNISRFKQL